MRTYNKFTRSNKKTGAIQEKYTPVEHTIVYEYRSLDSDWFTPVEHVGTVESEYKGSKWKYVSYVRDEVKAYLIWQGVVLELIYHEKDDFDSLGVDHVDPPDYEDYNSKDSFMRRVLSIFSEPPLRVYVS